MSEDFAADLPAGLVFVNTMPRCSVLSTSVWRISWAHSRNISTPLEQAQRRCVRLLALQAPVATDLWVLIEALHAVGEVERICALARHVALIVRFKHPHAPVSDGVAAVSARMGVLAARLAHDAADAIETRDGLAADWLAQADDEVDALRDHLLAWYWRPAGAMAGSPPSMPP